MPKDKKDIPCVDCGVWFYCDDLGWEPAGKDENGKPLCAYCVEDRKNEGKPVTEV